MNALTKTTENNVTGGMIRDRIRQITQINNSSFHVVMMGGSGEHQGFGATVGEALQKARSQRDAWEASNREAAA